MINIWWKSNGVQILEDFEKNVQRNQYKRESKIRIKRRFCYLLSFFLFPILSISCIASFVQLYILFLIFKNLSSSIYPWFWDFSFFFLAHYSLSADFDENLYECYYYVGERSLKVTKGHLKISKWSYSALYFLFNAQSF